jgi:hypothetical protein
MSARFDDEVHCARGIRVPRVISSFPRCPLLLLPPPVTGVQTSVFHHSRFSVFSPFFLCMCFLYNACTAPLSLCLVPSTKKKTAPEREAIELKGVPHG